MLVRDIPTHQLICGLMDTYYILSRDLENIPHYKTGAYTQRRKTLGARVVVSIQQPLSDDLREGKREIRYP